MFAKIKNNIVTSFQQEDLSTRLQRVKLGVLFGIIGTTAYVITSSLINPISFPQIPFGIDWLGLIGYWFALTTALSLAGAIAGWATEDHNGVVGGGVMMGLLILLLNTISYLSSPGVKDSYFKILVTTVPLIAVAVLIALVFRWAINRQVNNKKDENLQLKQKKTTRLYGTLIVTGLVLGIFARFDQSIINSLKTLDTRLQVAGAEATTTVRFPENVAASVSEHFGTPYQYLMHHTNTAIGAVDVTIRFNDGYTLTCLIPTDSSLFLVIPACSDGRQLR